MRRLDESKGVATLPDVAQRAGVSTATAARALGGYGSVREATRQRVVDAAEALGYRANVLARSMITGSTQTIGVIISDIENPFFRRSLRGITDTARSRGFEVLLANTDEELEKERSAVSLLADRRVDGMVVCPADAGDRKHLREVIASGTPIVLLDRRVAGLAADTVGIDNRRAARLATERLLELGHKRIAIVTGGTPEIRERLVRPDMKGVERLSATTVGARAAGYRDALTSAGIAMRSEYLSANGFRREDAVAEVNVLMSLPEPPTAILAVRLDPVAGRAAVLPRAGYPVPGTGVAARLRRRRVGRRGVTAADRRDPAHVRDRRGRLRASPRPHRRRAAAPGARSASHRLRRARLAGPAACPLGHP